MDDEGSNMVSMEGSARIVARPAPVANILEIPDEPEPEAFHSRNVVIPESPWDEVIQGLWVGGSEYGYPGGTFGAVISVYDWHRDRKRWLPKEGTPHIVVPFYDAAHLDEDIVLYCAKQVHFWRDRRRQNVLVRCQAGLNRSSLVAATYLIVYKGYTGREAIGAIRRARGEQALFNAHFRRWLEELAA